MANVQVIQRHAHLAGPVRIDHVQGRDGEVARATLTAISNTRRGGGSGEAREEATAIQWTLWGEQAKYAALYLGKGSHVNVVGRLRNDNYDKDGATVYGMAFTADEIDYLDNRAEGDARRTQRDDDGRGPNASNDESTVSSVSGRRPRAGRRTANASA